ncbi:hypothetical protein Peur_015698 [Populus x canadensis]
MTSAHQVKILDVHHVTPFFTPPEFATELSLPLTFFDIMWLKLQPVGYIFFYKLTESTPAFFNSVILPKLKHSLSHTLIHFLPLAGNITWPPQATTPIILYTPNDAIQLTVAESNADFDHLSGNDIREAMKSHLYLPELPVTDAKATAMTMQITLFPNQGFCVGMSSHHSILDGTSYSMFIKAWSYISTLGDKEKQQYPTLLQELTPVLDRTGIQDPAGFEKRFLNAWLGVKVPGQDPNCSRSLKLLPVITPQSSLVRAVVEVSREQINKLRERVRTQIGKIHKEDPNETKLVHMSSFVLLYAYVVICIVKSKGLEKNRKVVFGFLADCRARLDPPIHDKYFGNCLYSFAVYTEAEALVEENGFAWAVERLSDTIRNLEKGVLDGVKEALATYNKTARPGAALLLGVAGSTHYDVYGTDLGWGRPEKVEITSIDQNAAISMTKCKHGSGVEFALVLEKHEMEKFMSLFVDGVL